MTSAPSEDIEDLLRRSLEGGEARTRLREVVHEYVPSQFTESEFARRAGVQRSTVRSWLGKR